MVDLIVLLVFFVILVASISICAIVTGKPRNNYFCQECGCLNEIHHNGRCGRLGCPCGKDEL